MSYVFDIYRGNQKPVRNFEEYAVFVSFFPLLVAGPIERANHLLPQVQKPRIFNYGQSVQGIYLIIWGLFKKVVIADNLGSLVDIVFNNPHEHSTVSLIFAAIGFSFQIYCDFSGYSDIASGVAKLFGFELLKNFDFPYWSKSIPEFWKKWHISLSSWFRDYVYFSLGGSRVGIFKAVCNVIVVFVLSAFWHGANWTFLVWGIIHALFYIPGFINSKINKIEKKPLFGEFKYLSMLGTFIVVTIAWVFFRSESISKAIDFFREFNQLTMGLSFIKTNTHMVLLMKAFIGLLILLIFEFYSVNRSRVFSRRFFALIVFCILLLGSFKDSMSFIYFQF
jgi:D-alanyl-lipoteichoic acid acyltransferase DltB (MBOAT superfamily)